MPSAAATLLVLQFHNASRYPDLNWVGESIAERLRLEFSAANQIVLGREVREEGLKRLSLRPDADFTKATLIKLGQNLDADFICYGSFDVKAGDANIGNAKTEENKTAEDSGPPAKPALKDSSVQIETHFLDLRKLKAGKDFAEAGKLTDLSRLEEHLAWQSLAYLDPGANRPMDEFLNPQKMVKLEAEESYARGLLSTSPDGRTQWFRQANILDSRLAGPAYELGKLSFEKKEYRQALTWLGRVPSVDPRYADARFRMGLAAYRAGNYSDSANYFREISKSLPLNEIFNNLGAAENQMNMPAAADDLRRAAEGDGNDPVYRFNLGAVLLKNNRFDEAAQQLSAVLDRDSGDEQARMLLERAKRRAESAPGAKPLAPDRLKQNFDETAYRQLKAMLQK